VKFSESEGKPGDLSGNSVLFCPPEIKISTPVISTISVVVGSIRWEAAVLRQRTQQYSEKSNLKK